MPAFRYTAVAADGAVARGVLEAASEEAAVESLRRAGSLPLKVVPSRGRLVLPGARRAAGGALRPGEVVHLTRQLATMLRAGQDLDRALRFVAATAPNARVRTLASALRDTVRGGSPFAAALARHPGSFTRLYVGLVRAGEAGGALTDALDRLGILLERQEALARSVRSAMIYPALLLMAALVSVQLLAVQVLPQFAAMFEQSGAVLPASTRTLLGIGRFLGDHGPALLAALGALFLLARWWMRRPGARALLDRLVLRLPVAGGLVREVLAARFTRALGALLLNGMPLIAALAIVRDLMGNAAAVEAVEAAGLSARGGAGLSEPLAATGVFPERMIHLLRLGEDTAQLGQLALRAAEIHEAEVQVRAQRLVALLVPGITIVMGAVIAGLVSSLLLAMLSLNDLAG